VVIAGIAVIREKRSHDAQRLYLYLQGRYLQLLLSQKFVNVLDAHPLQETEIKGTCDRSIRCFHLPTNLYDSAQRRRIRTPSDEFSRAFVGKEPIIFYRECDIPFHSLDFVRFHRAPQLLDQGTASMSEFA
jgi:hypothetical protein